MESLFAQFAILSEQALCDKNFDPYTIEDDLMKLFEVEAYKAWAAMELDQEKEVEEAENFMKEAEDHLNTAMEEAMDEFRRFEEEMNEMAKSEYDSLVNVAERARNMGKTMEKVATIAAKKYIETAVNSAGASMKSAFKAISSHSKKVHPS
ncbi:hypothetical protein AABB24_002102 [Solanum stoloniferum]|uniref:Maternal effect embryo arrest 9 n=2 Tax=Solanum TaxID=4107 RepID=A0AAF0PX40_SOLVR|nr:uncharacterized protein LOC125816354 [Solanum verrucosum]KAH0766940.1 hypothetical protein KY285_002811 [Solanum tuberosum]WMV12447.1 hypothetical protein MTR67_005832 [Solanum verrucosum]